MTICRAVTTLLKMTFAGLLLHCALALGEVSADVRSDESTTALVRSRLQANANTRDLQIDVATTNGIVTLKGQVGSAEEKELAALLVRNTDAVARVQNELIVRQRSRNRAKG